MSEDPRHPGAVAESEKRLRFLDDLGRATRTLSEPGEILQATARLLGSHLGANRCAYAQVEDDQDHFDLIGDYNDGVASIVGRYAFSDFGAEVLRLMRCDLPYVNPDVDRDPVTAGTDLAAYRLTQIQAVICVPLHKDGRFVAAMAVHQKGPRPWTAAEIELVQQVVARCWESLHRARADLALREAHQRLSLAMSAGGLGDWTWDAASDLMLLGERAAEMYGITPGRPTLRADIRLLIHPGEREAVRANAERAFAENGIYRTSYRVLPADGGPMRWVFAQGKPNYGPDGRVSGMSGVVQDITEAQRNAEERRALLDSERAARQEAERASAIKDEFLATLSHELRTPLGAILGWAHILRRKLPAGETDLHKGVDVIERSTRVQTQLIEDLLDMSRITSGKLRLDVQPVSPIGFVEAAVDTIRPAADAAQVRIEAMLDPAAGPVSGDPGRLQQVVWNLLANAVKFTPRGGTVRVLLQGDEAQVEISISDTGVGIQPEVLPHVFDRFRQGDGSITRRFGGLGLGLSIVKHLVELHGGSVQASSAGQGQGATFAVRLPVHAAHGSDHQAVHPAAGPASRIAFNPSELQGVKVLVVDDEADSRELLRRVLEDSGATVVEADGAEAALRVARDQRCDVLVSDIGMPDVDGYELLRRIRQLGAEGGGALPAIALTAFARSEDRIRALRAGFT
ncbi:MAG: response regulator, partial [Comamonadaceae bacterium]